MKIHLPENVKNIISTLMDAGYEAYAVGGCIRDSILGRVPGDFDITTSAKPADVKKLFRRTVDTGIQHGTVTVMIGNEGYEITTYRIDGEYEDNRHPKEVIFTSNLIEDLKRRDFTINAMAYNDIDGLVDEFDGICDLENKIIRCVGNPMERFTEDALRIMRAVRFSAQLGYEIEENTCMAAGALAQNLSAISAERIQVELVKLLTSDHPDYIKRAYDMGVTKVILPEFDEIMKTPQNHPHHYLSVGEHTLQALTFIKKEDYDDSKTLKYLRLAMLFHDFGKPQAKTTDESGIDHFHGHAFKSEELASQILHRLHFDNDTIRMVKALVLYHDYHPEPTKKAVRRAIYKTGENVFPLLFPVEYADIMAQSEYKREEKLTRLSEVQKIYQQILEDKDCLSIKNLAVTGKDLIAAGVAPGPKLGEQLARLLDIVLDDPSQNTRDILLSKIKE